MHILTKQSFSFSTTTIIATTHLRCITTTNHHLRQRSFDRPQPLLHPNNDGNVATPRHQYNG
jgi:hypothetical protein